MINWEEHTKEFILEMESFAVTVAGGIVIKYLFDRIFEYLNFDNYCW